MEASTRPATLAVERRLSKALHCMSTGVSVEGRWAHMSMDPMVTDEATGVRKQWGECTAEDLAASAVKREREWEARASCRADFCTTSGEDANAGCN